MMGLRKPIFLSPWKLVSILSILPGGALSICFPLPSCLRFATFKQTDAVQRVPEREGACTSVYALHILHPYEGLHRSLII